MKLQTKYFVLFPILILLLLFTASCNTTEPPGNETFALKLEDVSSTEAWIQLTTNNIQLPTTINLLKNNSVSQIYILNTQDSLLYIDSLLPNQTYKILATMQQGNNASNELSVTTLDTTSHNFTWQTFEFGQHSSSVFYDVAIINENNIWAVGEIYMNDSLGNPDPHAFNAVHWDGSEWKIIRIKYYGNCSAVEYPPLKAIWAFSENNIVVTNGGSIGWFDGSTIILDCGVNPLLTGAINKIWGTSSKDFYVVGNNGNIAHYQNGSWTKIESGTTTNINDAWGVFENGISTVYSPVSSFFNPGDKKILKIFNNKVDSISWKENRLLYSCWTNSNNYLYVCGSGVYQNKSGQWRQENLPSVSMNMVRGNAINDIFIIGDFGLATHFNGSSWQVYNESFGDIWGLAFKQNIVAFVGQKNGFGAITIGYKN